MVLCSGCKCYWCKNGIQREFCLFLLSGVCQRLINCKSFENHCLCVFLTFRWIIKSVFCIMVLQGLDMAGYRILFDRFYQLSDLTRFPSDILSYRFSRKYLKLDFLSFLSSLLILYTHFRNMLCAVTSNFFVIFGDWTNRMKGKEGYFE